MLVPEFLNNINETAKSNINVRTPSENPIVLILLWRPLLLVLIKLKTLIPITGKDRNRVYNVVKRDNHIEKIKYLKD